MVDAPFADAAVVALLGMLVSDAPEPENVVAVTTFAVKLPAVSLATMVDAPFADAADVLALTNVPEVMFVAFEVSVVAEVAKPETAPEAIAMLVLPAAVSLP
jgi:hypothetical protein